MGLLNGKHMFINNLLIDKVEVDACNTGAGMAFRSDWLYINWELDWGRLVTCTLITKKLWL